MSDKGLCTAVCSALDSNKNQCEILYWLLHLSSRCCCKLVAQPNRMLLGGTAPGCTIDSPFTRQYTNALVGPQDMLKLHLLHMLAACWYVPFITRMAAAVFVTCERSNSTLQIQQVVTEALWYQSDINAVDRQCVLLLLACELNMITQKKCCTLHAGE